MEATAALHYQTSLGRWLLLVLLSAFAVIMLPRQFHVTVVENRTAGELRMAGLLFPRLSDRHQHLRHSDRDCRVLLLGKTAIRTFIS